MSILYPALGAAIAVAGGDKLAGETSDERMFRGLGLAQGEMQTLAAVEVLGHLLMAPLFTRHIGGAVVAAASAPC